jgi:hypothetical protein
VTAAAPPPDLGAYAPNLQPGLLRETVQPSTTIAAPLLAGFSLTGLFLVLQTPTAIRLQAAVLIDLSAAVVVLIMTVQCGFWAVREIKIMEAQIEQILDNGGFISSQISDTATSWVRWAKSLYDLGILLLLAGLTLALVPRGTLLTPRLAAVGVVGVGFLFEVGWVVWSFKGQNGHRSRASRRG